jgi:hypothetical protein
VAPRNKIRNCYLFLVPTGFSYSRRHSHPSVVSHCWWVSILRPRLDADFAICQGNIVAAVFLDLPSDYTYTVRLFLAGSVPRRTLRGLAV